MSVLAQLDPATTVFIVALLLTAWILLMRTQKYFTKQRGEAALGRSKTEDILESRGHHLDVPNALSRWEVDMHETAREFSARLDNKMSAIAALIADADRAAARLEAAIARSGGAAGELPARPTNQAEALLPAAAAQAAESATAEAVTKRSGSERRDEIYMLSDYGFDAAAIARRVDSPIGEVELILGLRGKK